MAFAFGASGIAGASFAQDASANAPQSPTDPASESQHCGGISTQELLRRSYNFQDATARKPPIEISVALYRPDTYQNIGEADASVNVGASLKRAPEGGPIIIRLNKPGSVTDSEWQNSSVYGAAQAEQVDVDGSVKRVLRVQMPVREKTKDHLLIDALMPEAGRDLTNRRWTIIPIICGGPSNRVLGYGSASVLSVSVSRAWTIAILGTLAFWFVISAAAWQLNRKKLEDLWGKYGGAWQERFPERWQGAAKILWKVGEAGNPVFISQDSLGFGSLARFQILLFTTVVGCVLLYVFMHSGILSNISDTVLLLLGVTVGGGTLARATGDWVGISLASRRLLIGAKILVTQQDKPRWSDLFETQGEMDVAKIQALLFTILISISIFSSGNTGLNSFDVPQQIVYLALLSQGTYIIGKIIPADTRRRMEDDLAGLRKAALDLLARPGDAQLQQAYNQAQNAAKVTLEQTYVERFDGNRFDVVTADPARVL
ncbi:hypothetical protein [Methylobacterium sp. Leaf100]|uniref:hypothetical protein n=1 Tax=Methylobacterium sp. Leaf100 TaxID=1736252 RepID=UPI00138ED39C|nr:hypothetical protein [Methylobacterium sp. Leaf100]